MSALNQLTIAAARDALKAGETSATDLTAACLTAIEAAGKLNAFVHHTPDLALKQACAADERIGKGDAPAMCGIPLGIKDLYCTRGVPSQAASAILAGFKPEYESTVTQNLFDAGAVMLGKLNMDEFAMGSSNETSVYGNAVNPWRRGNDDAQLTPGGSSGRFGQRGRGRPLPRGHRHRHRRLDPPTCGIYRHYRHQTNLWPLFQMGHCRLCLVARSGRADDQRCARRGDHADCYVRPRSQRQHLCRSARAGF